MQINFIGSGWLALPAAAHFQNQGHQVLVTTTQSNKTVSIQSAGLKTQVYELGEQLSDSCRLFDTDVLIIAITSKDLAGFDVLLDQINDSSCQHLIYISSTSVYANDGHNHDETSEALNFDSPILKIERLVQSHPSTTIIRMAGLVGPGRHPGNFFRQGRTLKTPDAPVNLIHLDDCINIVNQVMQKNAWNEIFNACADTHPNKALFYSTMAKQLGLPTPKIEQVHIGSHKTIDNQKIKSQLGYQFIYPDVMTMKF